MPLLGTAAMLLSFDVEDGAIEEHDRWHTQEHLPERLAIPGFLRGTRWVATESGPRYMVLYEVADLAVLTSAAYLSRLNQPSPWTSALMPHYRGMNRGLCEVLGSFGHGQGASAALIRFTQPPAAAGLEPWLLGQALPAVPGLPGLGSAHLLRGAQAATMTQEQRIRGADRPIDRALIVMGYDGDAVAACAATFTAPAGLPARGASEISLSMYRWSYSLACGELPTPAPTPDGRTEP
jgi:hypothetical protein